MSFNAAVFDRAVVALRGLPTSFKSFPEGSQDKCCLLHVRADCPFSDRAGCALVPVGTHASIRALYDDSVEPYCHAETGQLVLDKSLFTDLLKMNRAFVERMRSSPARIHRRYAKGFSVGVSVYGSGYCYLLPVALTARSRAARCLGPFPFLADVLRFALALGDRASAGYVLDHVTGDFFHVSSRGIAGYWSFIDSCARVLGVNPVARVGAEISQLRESIDRALSSFVPQPVEVAVNSGPPCGGFAGFLPDLDYVGFVPGDEGRLPALLSWLASKGLVVPEAAHAKLLLSTCALSHIVDANVKIAVSMWAVVGDHIMKLLASTYCAASGMGGADLARLLSATSNSNLARVFDTSGLRACAAAQGLSLTSKRNADMMEAVVGVLSFYLPVSDLRAFLANLGILSSDVIMPRFDQCDLPVLDSVGMSSRQQENALKLCAMGLL